VYGGRNNQCSSFFATVQLTGETLNQTYTLPLNNAAIPGACAGNPTTQISGDWQVRLDDFQNNFRGGINFRLRDPANINANVRVDKFIDSGLAGGTLPSGGGIIRWNLSVQNDGPDPAANVQLLDSMPAGINFVSMTQTAGPTFNCAAPVGQNITCTGLTSLQQGQFASFLLTATYPASPGGTTFTNNSSVFTSTNDLFITNNTSSAGGTLTPTNTPNQCQLTKNDLTVASTSAAGATVNYSAPTSTGATCTGTIQCSPASGSVFPIGVNPVGCVITNGNGAGGGQFNVIVTDAQRPDLTITKTSYAPYYLGQSGLYSLDVKNIGALSTNGTTVTVTEQPPQGVNVTNMSGTGWTCNVGTYSCTRNTVLAANASYPKIWVTVSFPTYQSSGPNITNTATVSGGGDGTAVNNTATNLSQVLPLGTGNAVTASGVTVSGRVMSGDGRGLTNARVMIAAPDGETRLVTTGRLGVFNFDDLETGQTYVISVASRRYSFSPQIVPVNDNVSGLIFIPNN
ncbi:MAG: carboxypeptidase regulatory-like domain-containing protein, partial [Pyrinomonadaceae bacterium]